MKLLPDNRECWQKKQETMFNLQLLAAAQSQYNTSNRDSLHLPRRRGRANNDTIYTSSTSSNQRCLPVEEFQKLEIMPSWPGKITVNYWGEEDKINAYNILITSPQGLPTIPSPSLNSTKHPPSTNATQTTQEARVDRKYDPTYQMLLLKPYLQARTLAFTTDGTLSAPLQEKELIFTMQGDPREKAPEARNCLDIYAQYMAWYNISRKPKPVNIEDATRLWGEECKTCFLGLRAYMVYGMKYIGVKRVGEDGWRMWRDGAVDRY